MDTLRRTCFVLPVVGLSIAVACTEVRVVAVEISVMALEPTTASILIGDSVQLEARLLDGAGNLLSGHLIHWSSSDPDRVPVDETGLVRGLAAAEATITAAAAGQSAEAEVVVQWPAPGLTAVEPSSAQRLEAVDLVLTGTHFEDGVTTVDLGPGIDIEALEITGPGSMAVQVIITAVAPLGTRDVVVRTPPPGGGTATLRGGFTVLAEHPSPTLTVLSPAEGQREETLAVALTGGGFVQDLTTVSFGPDIIVVSTSVANPGALTATIAIGASAALGARDVSVANPAPGGGTATLAGGFTVRAANPVPTVAAVSPGSGQRQETLAVTVTGSGFLTGATAVTFGEGVRVDDVTVESPTALTATVTIAADTELGARHVTVTNPPPGGGTSRLEAGFTVEPENPSPAVTGVEPNAGQRRDRLDVVLTGSGFVPGLTAPSFGPDVVVHEVQVQSATSLTAEISIGSGATLGARAVWASNPPPGGGTGSLPDGFTVLEENPPPTATAALPDAGSRGMTLTVTLVGSGFVQGLTSVSFGEGITVNSVNVVFWTSLNASITIAASAETGPRDVTVTNAPPGGGTFIMHDGFTVLPF
jgi:hypothetical protein